MAFLFGRSVETTQLAEIAGAAIGAGGLGAVLMYILARRRTSGSIGTTDADRLWQQNDKLIDTQRGDIADLRNIVTDLRNRIAQTESRDFIREQDYRDCQKRSDVFETRMKAAEAILHAEEQRVDAKVELAEAKVVVAEQKTEIVELKRTNGGAL